MTLKDWMEEVNTLIKLLTPWVQYLAPVLIALITYYQSRKPNDKEKKKHED